MPYDIGIFLVIPAAIFAFWAQAAVRGAYRKYDRISTRAGLSGAETARRVLDGAGLRGVSVEAVPGELTDHYDPRAKVLRLSRGVYDAATISAVGIAAHEAGHAIQHEEGYTPLYTRNAILPVANVGSYAAWPLILLGFLLGAGGALFINIGLGLFAAVVAFQVVTLPVEFNASKRALAVIESGGYLDSAEADGARRVLKAAAMTYVAGAAVAVANLLRFVLLSGGRRRGD
jgi:Zn-dependent membrane protease YugP